MTTHAAADLAESARRYLALLVHHICRENNMLRELVEKELTPERLSQPADELAESDRNEFPPGVQEEHEKTIEALKPEHDSAADLLKLCSTT